MKTYRLQIMHATLLVDHNTEVLKVVNWKINKTIFESPGVINVFINTDWKPKFTYNPLRADKIRFTPSLYMKTAMNGTLTLIFEDENKYLSAKELWINQSF